MTWRRTEALTTVRRAADKPRTIVGLAVPYGVTSEPTTQLDGAISREAFAPDAFAGSVEHWMTRQDGARMAYRPAHGERPVGTVRLLRNESPGVAFEADIYETPAGDEYLQDVDAGLNGVSIEWGPGSAPSSKLRDGTMLHREARMMAIAGSIAPAYDGARIALRDMEEPMTTEGTPPEQSHSTAPTAELAAPAERDSTTTATVQAAEQLTPAQRSAAEAQTLAGITPAPIGVTRAEAVYGPRSGHSYFADLLHGRERGDTAALERLARHDRLLAEQVELMERAGDVLSSEIPGAYPNTYLPGLLTPRILKGRPFGGFFNRVNITDAQPKIFPKVTTSTTVTVQSAEGVNPAASDLATTAVTATPLLYGGESLVARQVLDGADPSVDAMLMQDLTEAYAQASETVIKTAVEAGATASGTAITAATPYAGLLGNIVKYQSTRFMPAEGQFIPSALYAVALAQADTSGRALLPFIGPQNSQGETEAGGAGANLLNASIALSWASTVNVVVTARRNDYVIYESPIATFRYEQGTGPAAVRIGIWAYLVVGTRAGGLSVTAA